MNIDLKLKTSLERMQANSALPNWDGYGARPVLPAVYVQTRAFLDALPQWCPVPDIMPEADGEIAIEWDTDSNDIFSVSIGAEGKLNYAGQLGDLTVHGVERFNGKVPEVIVKSIERIAHPLECWPQSE